VFMIIKNRITAPNPHEITSKNERLNTLNCLLAMNQDVIHPSDA